MNEAQKRRTPPGRAGFKAERGSTFKGANPAYRTKPAPGTLRRAVLDALIAGADLTSLDAWREMGTSRLAAHVYALRRMGWPIEAEEVTTEAREGRPVRIARYFLVG